MEVLVLGPGVRDAIIAHALEGYPFEVCGIVAGPPGQACEVYRGRNVAPMPRVAYELDTETLAQQITFEERGLTLVAIYHSHPCGPETPSETDLARAFYPDSVYLICSLADPARPALRGFLLRGAQPVEVPLIQADSGASLCRAGELDSAAGQL